MRKTQKKPVVVKFRDRNNYEPNFSSNFYIKGKNMLKNNSPKGNKRIFSKFVVTKNDQQKLLYLEGQNAHTLTALMRTGGQGITSIQSHDLKLLRLSSYVHILRHEHEVNILTIREGERRVARYVLMNAVELLKSSTSEIGGEA
jgi:hypothetical protein